MMNVQPQYTDWIFNHFCPQLYTFHRSIAWKSTFPFKILRLYDFNYLILVFVFFDCFAILFEFIKIAKYNSFYKNKWVETYIWICWVIFLNCFHFSSTIKSYFICNGCLLTKMWWYNMWCQIGCNFVIKQLVQKSSELIESISKWSTVECEIEWTKWVWIEPYFHLFVNIVFVDKLGLITKRSKSSIENYLNDDQ